MERLICLRFSSTSSTLTPDHVPTRTVRGVPQPPVADLGDVDEAVLVDADVHEDAEIGRTVPLEIMPGFRSFSSRHVR